MSILIMMIGLPASGKSTRAIRLALDYETNAIVSSDDMRKKLYGSEEIQGDSQYVFQCLHNEIITALNKNHTVIYDATNLTRKNRVAFIEKIKKKYPDIYIEAELMIEPLSVIFGRNKNRSRTVPEDVILRMLKSFDPPSLAEGFNSIWIYWSSNKTYIPTIEKLKNFNQDNKYHSLSLGDHILQTTKYCEEHHYGAYVTEAARYHDIGKFITKSFTDCRGNKTEDAHYYGHEHVSAYLYLNYANNLRIDAAKLIDGKYRFDCEKYLYISNLIDFHMKPYTSWNQSQKALERDTKIFGERFIKHVNLLHEADEAAK